MLALKRESVWGAFEALTAAEAGFKAYNAVMRHLRPREMLQRVGGLGVEASVLGPQSAELTFTSYLVGKGVAGIPYVFAELLPCCGMAYTAGTQTFANSSDQTGWKTASASHYIDGRRYRARGLMGSWRMTWAAGAKVAVDWRLIGGFEADPDATALLSGMAYDSTKPPLFAATGSLSIAGAAFPVRQCVVDQGNELVLREDANSTGGYLSGWIQDRRSVITLDPEAKAFAIKNWSAAHSAGDEIDLVLTLGSVAHNKIILTANNCQLTEDPELADAGGKAVDNLQLMVTGDDLTVEFVDT